MKCLCLWMLLGSLAWSEGEVKGGYWSMLCPKNWKSIGNGTCQRQFPRDPNRASPYRDWRFSILLYRKPLPPKEAVQLSYEDVQKVVYQGRKGFSGFMRAIPQDGGGGWANYNYLVPTRDGKGYYNLSLGVNPASELQPALREFPALIRDVKLEK